MRMNEIEKYKDEWVSMDVKNNSEKVTGRLDINKTDKTVYLWSDAYFSTPSGNTLRKYKPSEIYDINEVTFREI